MEPRDIKVGARYRNLLWQRWRRVDGIRNDVVTYSVEGVRSLTPMTMPLGHFAAWAEEEIRDDGRSFQPG